MTRKLAISLVLLPLVATSAVAQDADVPTAAPSTTPLLIITITVIVAVVLALWLGPKLGQRSRTPKAPHPDKEADQLSPQQQAVGAMTAFEKARLMAKKVDNAAPREVRRGEEAGDDHPS